MAALLTFLVVCSVSALVVAIYAATRGQPKQVPPHPDPKVNVMWDNLMSTGPFGLARRWLVDSQDRRIATLEAQLAPSTPNPVQPTLADRLAALEAKKGKK